MLPQEYNYASIIAFIVSGDCQKYNFFLILIQKYFLFTSVDAFNAHGMVWYVDAVSP